MPRISRKNQVKIRVAPRDDAGLHPGDELPVEVVDPAEARLRRRARRFEDAFRVLTGTYPDGYLETLDRQDAER